MNSYKDKCFCSFYVTCQDGNKCHRALTEDVQYKANASNLPIAQFLGKPECYKQREIRGMEKIEEQFYCLHDRCPECHGTGKKQDETPCVHYISCGCPKCSVRY